MSVCSTPCAQLACVCALHDQSTVRGTHREERREKVIEMRVCRILVQAAARGNRRSSAVGSATVAVSGLEALRTHSLPIKMGVSITRATFAAAEVRSSAGAKREHGSWRTPAFALTFVC